MQKIAILENKTIRTTKRLTNEIDRALVNHVYSQGAVVFFASLFCATIVYLGIALESGVSLALTIWAEAFLGITVSRLFLSIIYERKKDAFSATFWRNLYIISSFLGGASWGVVGIFFLSNATLMQQTLLVLMLAGVTSGSVPISAAIPQAGIAFLMAALLPFIMVFTQSQILLLELFDAALALYLIYSIVVSLKIYRLIRNSIVLQHEKSSLLAEVYEAKLELERINKKLHVAATHDPLTQVANRTLFKNTLVKEIQNARINRRIFGLLYMDVDNFKMINDRYGHHAGDIILLTIGERLKEYFGNNTTIARLGGDEFIVLVTKVDYSRQIKYIAGEVCRILNSPIRIDHHTINITVSIGISMFPKHGKEVDTLLRAADKSMYYVKQHGGGSFYLKDHEAAYRMD